MLDLIVIVPDQGLSFYFSKVWEIVAMWDS